MIQAGVEMQTVRNDGGRMNTVFKFWYESWVVLAVGSAVVVAEQLRQRRGLRRTASVAAASRVGARRAFWWMATPVRMDDRLSAGGLSLDGDAYLPPSSCSAAARTASCPADDLPLVDWLRANVHGIRVVAEAPGDDYRWTGRIAWLTGLPTPIGWPYHESQQRRPYGASLETRRRHDGAVHHHRPGVMARVLARYSVDYVVFGTQEHLSPPGERRCAASVRVPHGELETDRSTGVAAVQLFVASVDRRVRQPLRPAATATPAAGLMIRYWSSVPVGLHVSRVKIHRTRSPTSTGRSRAATTPATGTAR